MIFFFFYNQYISFLQNYIQLLLCFISLCKNWKMFLNVWSVTCIFFQDSDCTWSYEASASNLYTAQSAGAVEYTDCFSAEV